MLTLQFERLSKHQKPKLVYHAGICIQHPDVIMADMIAVLQPYDDKRKSFIQRIPENADTSYLMDEFLSVIRDDNDEVYFRLLAELPRCGYLCTFPNMQDIFVTGVDAEYESLCTRYFVDQSHHQTILDAGITVSGVSHQLEVIFVDDHQYKAKEMVTAMLADTSERISARHPRYSGNSEIIRFGFDNENVHFLQCPLHITSVNI